MQTRILTRREFLAASGGGIGRRVSTGTRRLRRRLRRRTTQYPRGPEHLVSRRTGSLAQGHEQTAPELGWLRARMGLLRRRGDRTAEASDGDDERNRAGRLHPGEHVCADRRRDQWFRRALRGGLEESWGDGPYLRAAANYGRGLAGQAHYHPLRHEAVRHGLQHRALREGRYLRAAQDLDTVRPDRQGDHKPLPERVRG